MDHHQGVAVWFNKVCKTKGLQPTYISLKTNGKTTRDHRTAKYAVKYRINQEIKYLYKKKQHLNQLLYRTQLEGVKQYNGMWQHVLIQIDKTQSKIMENTYQNLYKKIDILTNKHVNIQPTVINLTHKKTNQRTDKNLKPWPSICSRTT